MSYRENIVEILRSIAKRIGFTLPDTQSVGETIRFFIERLGALESDCVLSITIEDLLAIEDNLMELIAFEYRDRGLELDDLTPLAKLYYTEFRSIGLDEARSLDIESEDIAFENFIRVNLGRRLTAKQLREYLSYVAQLLRIVGIPS